MTSKRRQEGYLLIDNSFAVRNAPNPFPTEADMTQARAHGLTFPGMQVPVFESATITCTHCNVVVVLNPNRTRERSYCASCDAYLCDGCGFQKRLGAACLPLAKQFDDIVRDAERQIARNR